MDNNRKLRVLCLHGFNNTSEIFKYQLQYYLETYSTVIDFVFLDGPFACSKLPLKSLVKLGFEGCKVIDNNSKQSFNPNEKSFPPSPPGEIDYEGINSESQRFYCWMDSSKNIMKFDK